MRPHLRKVWIIPTSRDKYLSEQKKKKTIKIIKTDVKTTSEIKATTGYSTSEINIRIFYIINQNNNTITIIIQKSKEQKSEKKKPHQKTFKKPVRESRRLWEQRTRELKSLSTVIVTVGTREMTRWETERERPERKNPKLLFEVKERTNHLGRGFFYGWNYIPAPQNIRFLTVGGGLKLKKETPWKAKKCIRWGLERWMIGSSAKWLLFLSPDGNSPFLLFFCPFIW